MRCLFREPARADQERSPWRRGRARPTPSGPVPLLVRPQFLLCPSSFLPPSPRRPRRPARPFCAPLPHRYPAPTFVIQRCPIYFDCWKPCSPARSLLPSLHSPSLLSVRPPTTASSAVTLTPRTAAAAADCTRSYTVQVGDICDSISANHNVSTYVTRHPPPSCSADIVLQLPARGREPLDRRDVQQPPARPEPLPRLGRPGLHHDLRRQEGRHLRPHHLRARHQLHHALRQQPPDQRRLHEPVHRRGLCASTSRAFARTDHAYL